MPKMSPSLNVVSFLLFTFSLLTVCDCEHDEMLPKIGIVGAGVSGTSCAYFLRQLFGDNVEIDILEADKVGGRLASINIDGQSYEAGGSVFHGKNKYIVQFAEELIKDQPKISNSGDRVGLYGPDGMVFETSQWKAVTLSKLLWRYGFDVNNLQHWLDKLFMKEFENIYAFQEKGMAFTTLEDLLQAMGDGMLNMTRHSMRDVLVDAGLSDRFVQEFGMAAMRVNYGQTTAAHGLVGAVSMYGIEPDLWSIQGGNEQIPARLLEASKANLIHAQVTSINLVKREHGAVSYEVDYDKLDKASRGSKGTREYDIVIMATPVHGSKSKIAFVDFAESMLKFGQDYHRTVAMFIQGNLNKTTFGIETEHDFPSSLLTVDPEMSFNSIGKGRLVNPEKSEGKVDSTKPQVWKTFLNKIPTDELVNSLFETRTDFRLVDWLAYPEYKPGMDLPPFVLNERLYYINAIESAASAIEMSAIGAKNVALLAFNHFYGNFDKIDELHLPGDGKKSDDRSDL